MFRKLYLSFIGFPISIILNVIGHIHKPFMVYGYFNKKTKKFYKHTRISSSAKLIEKKNIDLKNNIWIGHYCLLDGIGGIEIGEGVNVASHSVIYTHSSHIAIRLLGKKFIEIPADQRKGYIIKNVKIGEYTFIGTSCVILPGISIGKGCIIGAGSVVNTNLPDYAVALGNPAKIIGDSRNIDKRYILTEDDMLNYYDK